DLTRYEGDILTPICEIVAGYDAVNPLEDDEIDVLYDLLAARYALTLLILAWRSSRPAGGGYLVHYQTPAHYGLETILTLGRNTVRRRLRDACRFPVYCPKPGEPGIQDESAELLTKRHRFLGPTLELSYDNPVHVVKGQGPWLFASDGSRLLDAYNNVPHVG